jgi:DNA-binding Lrp family transcriptional regulator
MDKTDEMIIQILKEDSRLSFVDISKRVGLSEAAVRRRVSNLIDAGVIRKFTVEVNDSQQTSAIIFVSVSPSVPTIEVSKRIMGVQGVVTVYETTGPSDITAVLRGSNIAALNKSVDEIRKLTGVLSTNTSIILRSID